MSSATLLTRDETWWMDLSDTADRLATEGAHRVQGLGDGFEEAPTRAGPEALQIDRAALKLCIRADLWP
jgi:hypothetical protein